jgi:hypothetical protein
MFRVNVRILMLLIVLCGLALGVVVNRANTQRRAVAAVVGSGGSVAYDDQFENGYPVNNRRPRGPEWLRNLIGDHYFRNVTSAYFGSTAGRVSAADLEAIEGLDHLEQLIFEEPPGAGLEHLHAPAGLRHLELRGQSFDDAMLAGLQPMPRLESLKLWRTAVTDAGLSHLRNMDNLKSLGIVGSANVTGVGLSQLRGLNELWSLSLRETGFRDDEVAQLGELPALTSLSLMSTKLTDAGLARLAKLDRIEHLVLARNMLTDSGLIQLKGMKRLRLLNVDHTLVSVRGVAELRTAIPSLTQL